MALKPCRECGKDVSTDAATCPSCGVKSPTKRPLNKGVLLLALVGVYAVYAVLNPTPKATPEQAAAKAANDRQAQVLRETEGLCQFAVKRQLKAPSSAKFATDAGWDPDSGQYVNVGGTVTAVNSFNAPLTLRVACRYDTMTQRLVRADAFE
jgi:hypothetical protein